jgi:protein phosphatase
MPEAAREREKTRLLVPLEVDLGALTHVGKVRESNEDAYAVCRGGRYLECLHSNLPDSLVAARTEAVGHILIVADGMGGMAAGEVASHGAVATVIQTILSAPKWALHLNDPATRAREIDDLWDRARRYLAEAHGALRRQASSDPSLAGMGTTLTTVFSVGHDLFVLHVGDSRAYLFRDGRVTKVTRDQTVAQDYADLGMIPEDEVRSHRLSHVLTQAVGGPDEHLKADLHTLGVDAGDRLLMCTDGLTNVVEEDDIADILARGGSSQAACEALIQLALDRGAPDNVTAIVASYSARNAR